MFGIFKNIFSNSGNEELIQALKEGACLVDVRSPGEYSSGSVKGAINIPLDKISSQAGKLKGKTCVVVFCQSGLRSAQAKSILERNGIAKVINGRNCSTINQCVE
ncbi:MAG TPA: rhodanese-like domain-containing protein [Flavobacterium sp.]|nr:rhodanese-like domain-containing protein [Flavobacterium sp.]